MNTVLLDTMVILILADIVGLFFGLWMQNICAGAFMFFLIITITILKYSN